MISCNGGTFVLGHQWAVFYGVPEDTQYKYTSGTTGVKGSCNSKYPPTYHLQNSCFGSVGDEVYMLRMLILYGPLAVAIRKLHFTFVPSIMV